MLQHLFCLILAEDIKLKQSSQDPAGQVISKLKLRSCHVLKL